MGRSAITRRCLLGTLAAAATAPGAKKHIPIGLELFSVRDDLKKDPQGTVRAVAKMGYEGVEFFSPYFAWTPQEAKDMRKLLDDLGIRCLSTHNGRNAFTGDGVAKAIELNQILGSKFIIMASAGKVADLDGWKAVADQLSAANDKMKPAGIRPGFHNHQLEFRPIDDKRPIEVLATNTPKDVVLQLDVGTCVEVGVDPVAWIEKNPGRIASVHCKEYSRKPGVGYEALFGEGDAPWAKIFAAAERVGGVEHYLVEQEGSKYPPLETAERCLASIKKLRG